MFKDSAYEWFYKRVQFWISLVKMYCACIWKSSGNGFCPSCDKIAATNLLLRKKIKLGDIWLCKQDRFQSCFLEIDFCFGCYSGCRIPSQSKPHFCRGWRIPSIQIPKSKQSDFLTHQPNWLYAMEQVIKSVSQIEWVNVQWEKIIVTYT